ncbi:MAG: S-layer homology domain-containing protein [Peptostreptococcaceae bacterium]|nr:S-layer homology domain-containing protein [Peptostreptococcaceae bacterium]
MLTLIGRVTTSYAAISTSKLEEVTRNTAKYVHTSVKEPQVGSIGGEWAILGLARSGYDVPSSYYENYYKNVEQYVTDHKGNLHDVKYTEYSRVVIALSAIGKDPRNVGGYDLLKPLGDFEKTKWQGINGSIFALIALDTMEYSIPKNPAAKTQATRDKYIQEILDARLTDGGWAMSGTKADPDVTAMALQALAKYQSKPAVKVAVQDAVEVLSKIQNAKGGYDSWGTANSESTSQVIVALGELGISLNDPRFIKNGNTLLDDLLSFYEEGKGFKHTYDGSGQNQMATEQAFYALVSAERASKSKNSLYRMSDVKGALSDHKKQEPAQPPQKAPNTKDLINKRPITSQGKTFGDIKGHKNQKAIEELAARGVISGKSAERFEPKTHVTRAEFAVIVINGLGIEPKSTMNSFTDVKSGAWYAPYVATAHQYKIVGGVGNNKFDPNGKITIQEAATMIANAGALSGKLKTIFEPVEIRDRLAQFSDYTRSSDWARSGLTFCYANGILDKSELNIRPKENITRGEVAEVTYRLMNKLEIL